MSSAAKRKGDIEDLAKYKPAKKQQNAPADQSQEDSSPETATESTQPSQRKARSFVKYSQNMDISTSLGLDINNNGEVINKDGDRVLYIPMGKNVKIRRKLESILGYLWKDLETNKKACKEVVMIASGGDSVQKMISIVELLKQKLNQLQNLDGKDGFSNNCIAKLPAEKLVISGKEIPNGKLSFNFTQLNYVDYMLIEQESPKRLRTGNSVSDEVHDKETLKQVLRINKLMKVPVMYVYLHFYGEENLPVKYVNKFKNLAADGWSMQQS